MFIGLLTSIVVSFSALCSALPTVDLEPRDICVAFLVPSESSIQCTAIFEDRVVSGIEYDLYRFPEVPDGSPYQGYIDTVLNDVSGIYSSFIGSSKLSVVIYLVDIARLNTPTTLASTIRNFGTCYMRLATHGPKGLRSEMGFKATVAHELYHCVQKLIGVDFKALPGQSENSMWWIEGTAVFMENYFYPDVNAEVGHINFYDPSLLPTDEANAYAAGVIFQYLFNAGWTLDQINTWMAKQTLSYTTQAEISRMSADTDLTAAWPGFVENFVQSSIKWKDGTLVRPFQFVSEKLFPVPEAPLSKQMISISPFEINKYATSFAIDKVVTMTFIPDGPTDTGTVLLYRKGKSGAYQHAPPGEVVNLQNTDDTDCPSSPEYWEFIITSTEDPTQHSLDNDNIIHAELDFSVTPLTRKRANQCKLPSTTSPSTPSPGDLDTCLVGSWTLDISTMEAFLSQKLSTLETSNVYNLAMGGSSALTIDASFSTLMTFTALSISYDANAESFSFHTDIVIDGTIDGTIIKASDPSSFTWAQGSTASGSVHTTTKIYPLGGDFPLDFPFEDQYGLETVVDYTCQGSELQMTGFVGGKYTWAYTWVRT